MRRRSAAWCDRHVAALRVEASRATAARVPGAVILGYHSVARPPVDPGRLALDPERFAGHVRLLASAFRVLPLDELVARLRAGRSLPPRAVAVTFDDGYVDNLLHAAPLLREEGLPATVFVSTARLGPPGTWWWHTLDRALAQDARRPGSLTLVLGKGRVRWWPTATPAQRALAHVDLQQILRGGTAATVKAVTEQLVTWAALDPVGDRDYPRSVTTAELRRLEPAGLAVGAHGHRHLSLSRQPPEVIAEEVHRSHALLGEHLGQAPTGFSYPYGDHGRAARVAVARAGFSWAVGVRAAAATRLASRWDLPRLMLGHEDAATLERRLELLAAGSRDGVRPRRWVIV